MALFRDFIVSRFVPSDGMSTPRPSSQSHPPGRALSSRSPCSTSLLPEVARLTLSPESSPLTCSLADQGIKIRIRKDIRMRKARALGGGGGGGKFCFLSPPAFCLPPILPFNPFYSLHRFPPFLQILPSLLPFLLPALLPLIPLSSPSSPSPAQSVTCNASVRSLSFLPPSLRRM